MQPKVIFAGLAKFPDCEASVKFPDCEGGQDTWSVARMLLGSVAGSSMVSKTVTRFLELWLTLIGNFISEQFKMNGNPQSHDI